MNGKIQLIVDRITLHSELRLDCRDEWGKRPGQQWLEPGDSGGVMTSGWTLGGLELQLLGRVLVLHTGGSGFNSHPNEKKKWLDSGYICR